MTRRDDNDGDLMVLVPCKIERETAKAFLLVDGMNNEHWVPKSQCRRVGGGLSIKKWLIDKNDIYAGKHESLPQGTDYQRHSDPDDGWSPLEDPDDGRFAPPPREPDERDYNDIPF